MRRVKHRSALSLSVHNNDEKPLTDCFLGRFLLIWFEPYKTLVAALHKLTITRIAE